MLGNDAILMKKSNNNFGSYLDSLEKKQNGHSFEDSDSEDYEYPESDEKPVLKKMKTERAKPERAVKLNNKYEKKEESKMAKLASSPPSVSQPGKKRYRDQRASFVMEDQPKS